MALPDLMDLVMHDPRRLASLRAATGDGGQPIPDVETLWSKPIFTLGGAGGGGFGGASEKASLEDLLDRRRGLMLVDGGAGPQPVDTPFTSLVILTADPLPGAGELARFLSERIDQRFRDSIDPQAGVRVHVETSAHGAAPFAVYFGHGVHAPAPERAVRGAVMIRQPDDDARSPPTIGGDTPGGLYAGQARLAFSRSETLTAAVHPDLPAGTTFLLGRFPVDVTTREAGGLPPLAALPQTPEARALSIQVEPLPAESDDIDASYRITGVRPQSGRVPLALVDVALDRRPSRLRRAPPAAGPSLAVVGLAIPDVFPAGRVARYWVERTAGGRLLASAMLARRDALVVQGRDARLYDRREMRYARRGSARTRAESATFEGGRRSLLWIEGDELGFLAVPADRTAIAFGEDLSVQAFGSLDWIGDAVTVQFGSGQTARLDTLYDQDLAGFVAASGDGVFVQSAGDVWLLDGAKATAAGATVLTPGTRFALGPLLVEVRGRPA